MTVSLALSVIVPFYNAEQHIKNCYKNLINQELQDPFEVIFVNDGSTDNGLKILNEYKSSKIKVFSLSSNLGPSAARNLGIENSIGNYIYFLDVDDAIENNTFSSMLRVLKERDYDIVFSDKKWIENNINQRKNIFDFNTDKEFNELDINETMKKRFHDPISTGKFFGLTGRLIKRSLIEKNKIRFEKKLRYLEDDTFMWDVLGHAKNVRYIKKQLYSYYIHTNVNTALSEGINKGYPVSNFKLVRHHILKSLKLRNFSEAESRKISDQGFIFFIISALISYSRSILQGKIQNNEGKLNRKKMIDEIINDDDIARSIKNYSISKNESYLIPKAIKWKSKILLEVACKLRANSILKMRKKN